MEKGTLSGVFDLPCNEKKQMMWEEIRRLSELHRQKCPAYRRLCQGLGQESPWIPAGVFKETDLKSITEEETVKVITSSGTGSEKVSRIFLDAYTAGLQQEALCRIAGDFLGKKRRPMLIIDSPDVLRSRTGFSARGAGILGFAMLSSSRCFALDSHMNPDFEAIDHFVKKYEGEDLLLFGFTYIVWKFCQSLKESGKHPDLSRGYLIHGGGWKKMSKEAVSREVFARELKETCGITQISDYYGMAEQTGSIFMECEYGHLHASCYSDMQALRSDDFSECALGEEGILALTSVLPHSYPGHRILTEDGGVISGEDDCPCGRKGKYFKVTGRLPGARLRGCSDTLAAEEEMEHFHKPELCAGVLHPVPAHRKTFDELTTEFFSELSHRICTDPACRKEPEAFAFGFWCRRANLESARVREGKGIGMVFHIAPGNMPAMFAYSWAVSMLAGNGNIVRLPGRTFAAVDVLCEHIRKLLDDVRYRELKESNSFVRYGHSDRQTAYFSEQSDMRMIWGGDETIDMIQNIPLKKRPRDITFPDKYSIALISVGYLNGCSEETIRQLAGRFYNDTYGADQNACSSPKFVFWLEDHLDQETVEQVKKHWWQELARQSEHDEVPARAAVKKYEKLCLAYLRYDGLDPVQRPGIHLTVTECRKLPEHLWQLECISGMFFQKNIKNMDEICPWMDEKIQTVVCTGIDPSEVETVMRSHGVTGVDRIVETGAALMFTTVWDRKNLPEILSEVEA